LGYVLFAVEIPNKRVLGRDALVNAIRALNCDGMLTISLKFELNVFTETHKNAQKQMAGPLQILILCGLKSEFVQEFAKLQEYLLI
jgi:hypothetical protein